MDHKVEPEQSCNMWDTNVPKEKHRLVATMDSCGVDSTSFD